MIDRWVPGGLYPLGTDGFGRSETRAALRRHFEVDAECITVAALSQLARRGEVKPAVVQQAIKKFGHRPGEDQPDAGVKSSVSSQSRRSRMERQHALAVFALTLADSDY